MRPIDADKLKQRIREECDKCIHGGRLSRECERCYTTAFLRFVDNTPTISSDKLWKHGYDTGHAEALRTVMKIEAFYEERKNEQTTD